jgi:hypothetical protein
MLERLILKSTSTSTFRIYCRRAAVCAARSLSRLSSTADRFGRRAEELQSAKETCNIVGEAANLKPGVTVH